eukprot:UN02059
MSYNYNSNNYSQSGRKPQHNNNIQPQYTNEYEKQHLMMEEHNNRMVDDLSNQVGLLRNLALNVGKRIRDDKVLIGEVDQGFDGIGNQLTNTMAKLTSFMQNGSGGNYFLYLTIFIFVLFMGMYLFLRH